MSVTLRDAVDQKTRLRLRTEITKPAEVKPAVDRSILEGGPVKFKTVRSGRTSYVWLVDVKKDDVVLKENLDRKDSHSISATKFLKFYVRCD